MGLPQRCLIIGLLLPYVGLHLFVQAFHDTNGMRSIAITILKNGLLNVPPVKKSSLSQSLTKPTVSARRTSRVCSASKKSSYSSLETSFCSSKKGESRYVINSKTGRRIVVAGEDRKKTVWYDTMYRAGGYIAHRGVLVNIDTAALQLQTCGGKEEEEEFVDSTTVHSMDTEPHRWSRAATPPSPTDEAWYTVEPDIVVVTDEGLCDEHEHERIRTLLLRLRDRLSFVVKPSGLLTLPGKSQPDCLATRVGHGRPCHRLDLDTSGLVVWGNDADAHRRVSQCFEQRQISKTYVALVAGIVETDTGTVDVPIGKEHLTTNTNHHGLFRRWVCFGEQAREAVTDYTVSARFPEQGYTRVVLRPRTGRGHQIRLHMAHIGHPLLGDTLHAPPRVAQSVPRLCLHASELSFVLSFHDNKDEDNETATATTITVSLTATSIPPF